MEIVLVKRPLNNPQFKLTIKKDTKYEQYFDLLTVRVFFCCFRLSICQILRSLKTAALGNRLSRHGLATALILILVSFSSSLELTNLKLN